MNKIEIFQVKNNIENLLIESKSLREVLNKIGYNTNGSGGYQTFKNYCQNNNIEIPKYNYYGSGGYQAAFENSEVFVENSTYSRQRLKARIIKYDLIEYKCVKCKNIGEWMNEKLSLQLEHKNGINNDNRIGNLCFLCPNCHTQTDTYASKKRKKKVKKVKKTQEIKRCHCGEKISKKNEMCFDCYNIKQRKVKNRPSYEQLLNDIKETNYTKTGKKYGVSCNSIRKWLKKYEKNMEGKA